MIIAPLSIEKPRQPANGFVIVLLMLAAIAMSIFTGIEANISFVDRDARSAFTFTLGLTTATVFCVWIAWRYSPSNDKISSLLTGTICALVWPLFLYVAVQGTPIRSPNYTGESHALQVVYFYTLAIAMVGLAYARWKIRNPGLTKPQPYSWQTATYVIYSYGTPLWVFASIAAGLALVAGCLWYAAGYEGEFRGLSPKQFDAVNLWGTILYVISVGAACYLARSKLRTRFADKPYIWLTPSSMNIRDRMVLDWTKVTRIEFHWEQNRAGKRKTGLDIYSTELKSGEYATISFFNATIKPDEAMDAIKSVRQTKHILFEGA